jgi:hypothetical protein
VPVSALVVTTLLGACGSIEDHGPGITIWNRTDGDITVVYLRPDGTRDTGFGEISIGSGMAGTETMALFHTTNSDECAPGTLVAAHDGNVVASLARPCAGTMWQINQSAPSTVVPK